MSDRPSVAYGWAFLVARGRRKGYQSLLAPDFLVDSDEYGVLGQTVKGDFPAENAPRISSIAGLSAGDVTLAYRTQRLTPADLDGESADGQSRPPSDEFGRPLDLLYGFVCRAADISDVQEVDLMTAKAEALRTYLRFLADESGFAVETSRSFALRSIVAPAPPQPVLGSPPPGEALPSPFPLLEPAAAGTPVQLPPAHRNSRLAPLLAGALVVAASAIVWFVLLRGDGGPVTKVTINEPTSDTVDCSAPLVLRATITTESPTTITYRWESSRGDKSALTKLPIAKAGDQPIEFTVGLSGSSGNKIDLKQKLIIEKPNSMEAERHYLLTCR